MVLTILSDSDVKNLLHNLTIEDVESLQNSLRQALHEYSTGTQDDGCCSDNQPERTVLESHNGNTTLFMPSTSSSGIGMKVVTLATPPDTHSDDATDTLDTPPPAPTTPYGALTLMDLSGKPVGFVNAEEITAFRTALASSLLFIRRAKVKTLTIFGVGKQAYWHVRLALLLHGHTLKHIHFINRTFSDRAKDVMKSFIHVPAEVKESEGWTNTTFGMLTPGYGEYSRLLKDQVRSADIIVTTTPSTEALFDHTILTNTEGRRRGRLIVAIGSYKKHMLEVPPEILVQAVKRHGSGHHFHKHAEEGGVIVVDTLACVTQTGELTKAGIKESQTVELGELVLLERLGGDDDGSAITDSPPPEISLETLNLGDGNRALSHVFRNSTSSIPSSPTLGPSTTTTSLSSNKNLSSSSRTSSPSRKSSFSLHKRTGSLSGSGSGSGSRSGSIVSKRRKQQTEKEDEMCRWLSRGNVIYKSVGMGLMDLVVGGDLVRLARRRGLGITVEDF